MLSLQINSLLCYIHVNALILTNELKKLNAIEIEQVEPSVLIQDTTHKLFGIWEIDWSTVWLMNSCCCLVIFWFFSSFFFRCAVILSFSQAVIMLSSHPTPKENSHLLSLSLTLTQKESWYPLKSSIRSKFSNTYFTYLGSIHVSGIKF